jgi:hypothetical protein
VRSVTFEAVVFEVLL